jgi:tRNA G18 (ribose-2'-O)-methylase SpoU
MTKAICLTGWKYTINVIATMRTADGLGFNDFVILGKKKLDIEWIKRVAKRTLVDFVGGLHLFYLPDIDSFFKFVEEKNYTPVVMETNQGENMDSFKWPLNPIIIIGHEVEGIPMQYFSGAQKMHMNMVRTAISLNLACAASIAMYSFHLYETKLENKSSWINAKDSPSTGMKA